MLCLIFIAAIALNTVGIPRIKVGIVSHLFLVVINNILNIIVIISITIGIVSKMNAKNNEYALFEIEWNIVESNNSINEFTTIPKINNVLFLSEITSWLF